MSCLSQVMSCLSAQCSTRRVGACRAPCVPLLLPCPEAGPSSRPLPRAVFYVGKINPAKLANFPEINVFVLIASPENTVSVDPSLPRPTHKSASVLYSFVRLKPLPVSADPHFA